MTDVTLRIDDKGGIIAVVAEKEEALWGAKAEKAAVKAVKSAKPKMSDGVLEGLGAPIAKIDCKQGDPERPFAVVVANQLLFRTRNAQNSERLATVLSKVPAALVAIVDERTGYVYSAAVQS